jgi:AcrR family transcriptional regulator
MNREKHITILRTAEMLFNRFGIKKTAVDDIAAAARVAKGTIYNNFGSKEGILSAILKEKAGSFERGIESALQSLKDPVDGLKFILIERLKIIQNSPFLSDHVIRVDEMTFNTLIEDLDRILRVLMGNILDRHLPDVFPLPDKKRVLDTLLYQLRGIEHSVRGALGTIDRQKIEQDLDYLIRMIIPGRTNRQER